jgi:hypothetical protein
MNTSTTVASMFIKNTVHILIGGGMRMVASEVEPNAPLAGAAAGVGGAFPGRDSSSPIKEVYLVDSYGYEHAAMVTVEEYLNAKKRVRGLTDKYVLKILEELAYEYLDELDKYESLKSLEKYAWMEGADDVAKKLQEEASAKLSNAQSELVERAYEKLPVIWDDLTENYFTIVLADGRRFYVDWEAGLRIGKAGKWTVVEVRE